MYTQNEVVSNNTVHTEADGCTLTTRLSVTVAVHSYTDEHTFTTRLSVTVRMVLSITVTIHTEADEYMYSHNEVVSNSNNSYRGW